MVSRSVSWCLIVSYTSSPRKGAQILSRVASNVSGSSFTNCLYREFKLHFSVVRYSVLGVRFHCTTVYLHDLFLHLIIGGVQILIACLVYVKNNLTHLNYIVGWRERDLENASKDQTCSIWITRSQMYFILLLSTVGSQKKAHHLLMLT